MNEVFKFFKSYPQKFWIGLIFILIYIILILIFSRIRRSKIVDIKKKKAIKIAVENRIKQKNNLNIIQTIENKISESIEKIVLDYPIKQQEVLTHTIEIALETEKNKVERLANINLVSSKVEIPDKLPIVPKVEIPVKLTTLCQLKMTTCC